MIDENKLKKVYGTLQQGGYADDYNTFKSGFTGNSNYANRKKVYDLLSQNGADIGDTYEEFMNLMQKGSVPMSAADKTRFSAGAAAISAQAGQAMRRTKNTQRAAKLKQQQEKQRNDFGRVDLGTNKTPYGTDNAVKDNFGFDSNTGKVGTYITSSGEEIGDEFEAGQQQQAEDKYNEAYNAAVASGDIPSAFDVVDKNGNYDLYENVGKNGVHITEQGKMNMLDAKIADAYRRKQEIMDSLSNIFDTMKNGGNLDERMKLMNAKSQVEEEIRKLEAVRNQDDRSIWQNGWQGFKDATFKQSAWDFGFNEFQTMGQMERIKSKLDNGIPLTKEEQMLAQSKIGADAAAALADKNMGNAYRWLNIVGQSAPFTLDFLLTGGYGAITRAMERGAAKVASKYAMGTLGKNILKYTGIVAGDVLGSYAMAGTEQALKTGANIMNRHMGTLYQDEDGNYKFGTFDDNGNLIHDGGEDFGKALYKGWTAAMIENYTEKLFGHNYGLKSGAMKFMEKYGMARTADFFKKIGTNGWYKGTKEWMSKFGINGLAEEIAEEEVGIPLNAWLVGDNKLSDITDRQQQLDILFGVGLSVGAMYAISPRTIAKAYNLTKGGASKLYGVSQYYRFKNEMNNRDHAASELLGDKWSSLKELIDSTPNDDMTALKSEIHRMKDDGTLTDEQIKAILNYSSSLAKVRGYNLAKTAEAEAKRQTGEETTHEERLQQEQEQAYAEGQNADGEEQHEIQMQAAEAEGVLASMLGVSEEQLESVDLDSMLGENDDLDLAIYDYQNSQARYKGVMDNAQSKVDAAEQNAIAEVRRRTDTSRGTVRNATIKSASNDLNGGEDYGVFILSGNIAQNEDGSINTADSDQMILYFDPLTGKIEHCDASRFASLGEEVDAELTAQQAAELAKQKAIEEGTAEIDGKVGVGSRFVVTDNQGQQHVYEVLEDNGNGTASISIDGNVMENVFPSFDELQKMKDDSEKQVIANNVATRQSNREKQKKAEEHVNKKYTQITDQETGMVIPVTVKDELGNDKYADAKGVFLVKGMSKDGKKAPTLRFVVVDEEGNITPDFANKKFVTIGKPISLDEFKGSSELFTVQENNEEVPSDVTLAAPNTNEGSRAVAPDGTSEDKDNKESLNNNEEKQTLTFADGTPIPLGTDGYADLSQMTPEQTAEWLDVNLGDDAQGVIEANVLNARKALDKANGTSIKPSNTSEMVKAKQAKQAAIEAAKQTYDKAVEIQKAYNERRKAAATKEVEGSGLVDETPIEENEPAAAPITDEEADAIIADMESRAEPAADIPLTPENWVKEFGEDGTVQTPIGEVKMGENQVAKLFLKGRDAQLGMIKPTLENPDAIIEIEGGGKEGEEVERNTKLLFVKTFLNKSGKKVHYFTSVTVRKEGMEVSISNHIETEKRIRRFLKEGKLLYRVYGGAQTEQTQPSASVTTSHEDSAGSSEGKDNKKLSNDNEEKQTLTFADGTPVPMLEDGNPDFAHMTAEQAAELYDSQFGDAAEQILSTSVAEAKKVLDKAKGKPIKGKTFIEQKASKEANDKTVADAKAIYDNAKAVMNAYQEMLIGRSLGSAEGRSNLLDKAKRKFDRLKNTAEYKDDAAKQQELWNDTVGKVLHRLYGSTSVDVFDPDPRTVEEYVSSNLAPYSLNYEGTKTAKGVKQETGLERKDFAKSHILAAEGKGQTVDSFVHKLWENRPHQLENATDQDIRNAVIGLITGNMNAYDMRHVIENNRIAEAEKEIEDEQTAAENAAYQEEQRKKAEEAAAEDNAPSEEEQAEIAKYNKLAGIEEDWNEKISDYIAEKYPHHDGVRTRTEEEQAEYDAETEAIKNDATLREMRRQANKDFEDAENENDEEQQPEQQLPEEDADNMPFGEQLNESTLPFSKRGDEESESLKRIRAKYNLNDHNSIMEMIANNQVNEDNVSDADMSKTTKKAISRLATMMGVNVKYVHTLAGANGLIDGNNIYIALDAPYSAQFTIGHEMTHSIRKSNPAAYNSLKKLFLDSYTKRNLLIRIAQTISNYKKLAADDISLLDEIIRTSPNDAMQKLEALVSQTEGTKGYDNLDSILEEVVADDAGDFMNDLNLVKGLAMKMSHPLLAAFHNILMKIRLAFRLSDDGTYEQLTHAVKVIEKAYVDTMKMDAANVENNTGEQGTAFSIRQKPAPEKTIKCYKLMRLGEDGKLYPLFIDAKAPTELNTWYDGDSPNLEQLKGLPSGVHLIDNETGKVTSFEDWYNEHTDLYKKGNGNVSKMGKLPSKEAINWATLHNARFMYIEDTKRGQNRFGGEARKYWNLGINGSGTVSTFSMRPGWHAGSLPTMRQIGKGKDKNLRDDNFVWVEGEISADIDYNEEAQKNPDKDIPNRIPEDGYYLKATNANKSASQADRVGWYVAGAFKANRIMGDAEARKVIDDWNANHPDLPVEYDYERESGMTFNADTMRLEDKDGNPSPKFSLKVYHGSGADFDEFDFDHMGEGAGSQAFGWGGYVTSSKKIGKSYAQSGMQTRTVLVKNDGRWLEFSEGDPMFRVVDEAMYLIKSEGLRGARNFANRWKSDADTEDVRQQWEKVADLLNNHTKADFKSRYPSYLYEVEIPEDNGKNYLDWYETPTDEIIDKVAKALPTFRSFDVKRLKNETGKDLYNVISMRITDDDSVFNDDKAASKFLSSLGFTGIKYPAGTIMGGAKEGDMNYVIFKPEDMKIASHTKFSIRTYHGSQASFDHFDHSFMGSGEGAQAYGWGTYVSEVEGIAKAYAKQNAKKHNYKSQAIVEQARENYNYAKRDVDDTQYDLNITKGLLKQFQDKLDNAKKNNRQNWIKEFEQRVQSSKEDIAKMEDNLKKYQDVLGEKKKELDDAMANNATYDDVAEELDNVKSGLSLLEDELKDANSYVALYQSRLDEAKEELAKAKASGTGLGVDMYEEDVEYYNKQIESYKQKAKTKESDIKDVKENVDALQKKLDSMEKPRNLYTVEITDDTGDNYISWDGKLSENAAANIAKGLVVKDMDAAIDMFGKYGNFIVRDEVKQLHDRKDEIKKDKLSERLGKAMSGFRGGAVYEDLAEVLGGQKEASLFLKGNGFDGVKVIAQRNSGGNKQGNMNYVIFDENNAKIVNHEKFSLRDSNGNDFSSRLKDAISDTDVNPSEAQKKSGNYKKGHIKFGGYDFTIENPKGSERKGVDENGKEWSVKMHDTYGYIRGKIGKDGDHLDMFINDSTDLDKWDGNVYVVDQVNEDGSFDEHKVMYGYNSKADAKKAYLANYTKGWKGLGNITGVDKGTFDKWIQSSDRKTKPFAEYSMIRKADSDVRFSLAGLSGAATADKAEGVITRLQNFNIALQMEKEDKNAKAIKMATGWERGADGKWRYEMPDAKLSEYMDIDGKKVKRFEEDMLWTGGKLGDVVDAPELFKAYPLLKDVELDTDSMVGNNPSNGEYNPNTNRITIHASNLKYLNNLLNHEIQHAIQYIEGFAKGGSPSMFTDSYLPYALFDKLVRDKFGNADYETLSGIIQDKAPEYSAFKKSLGIEWDGFFKNEKANLKYQKESDYMKSYHKFVNEGKKGSAFSQYWKLAGEVEARNVEKRMGMSDEERRNSLAEETEDTPRDEQSIFFSLKDSDKTMFGMHNISVDKLRKAIKQGGFAAPSMGVVDSKNGVYSDYGEITLIPKAEKLDKRKGKNAGTFTADAWTPTYPSVTMQQTKDGKSKLHDDTLLNGNIPEELGKKLLNKWENYIEYGNVQPNVFAWQYLHEKGMNPKVTYFKGAYPKSISNKVMKITDNGIKRMKELTKEENGELIKLYNSYLEKKGEGLDDNAVKEIISYLEEWKNNEAGIFKDNIQRKIDYFKEFGGDISKAQDWAWKEVVPSAKVEGKVNEDMTLYNATQKVDGNKKLQADFNKWLDGKLNDYGVEEYLYNGETASGKPKYVPNTVENAVKIMKKQGLAGGYNDFLPGVGAFIAKYAPNANTLAAMKKSKDKLIPFGDERHKEVRDMILDEYNELARNLTIKPTDAFDDSGTYRMQELADVKPKDLKKYIADNWDTEVSDGWVERYNDLVDTIKNDYPVYYFETKFMRPVSLDEFEKAIVPKDTPKDVMDALKKAGIDVHTYEGKEDREKVTMDAIKDRDDIKFSIRAYHGTGAKFDSFDLSHALEGEGSETFGHGVYVTNSEKIGESYARFAKSRQEDKFRQNVSVPDSFNAIEVGAPWYRNFVRIVGKDGFKEAKDATLYDMDKGIEEAQATIKKSKRGSWQSELAKDRLSDYTKLKELFSKLEEKDLSEMEKALAYRYEVEIPDDDGTNYLDWKGEISKEAQKKIGDGLVENGFKKYSDSTFGKDGEVVNLFTDQNETYGEFYRQIAKAFGGKEQASDFLSSLGYVGIKYEAGTIHGGAKEGDYNYVIFNEADAKIVGNTKFSLRYSDYEKSLSDWKKRNHLAEDAKPLEKPEQKEGENIGEYAARMAEYAKDNALWKTAPKPVGYKEALKKWKSEHGLTDFDARPSRPVKADFDGDEDAYKEAMELYKQEKEKWADAPKPSDFNLQIEVDNVNKILGNLRKAMLNQKDYDKRTVSAVSGLVNTMLNLGWGDGLSRGKIERLLSAAKNAAGAADVKKHLDNAMNILVDNYLGRMESAYEKLTSTKGVRKDQSGVIKIGQLDAKGQVFLEEYNKALTMSDKDIEERLDKLDADDEMDNSRIDAINSAIMYRSTVGANDADMATIKGEIDKLKAKEGKNKKDNELMRALEDKILENKIDRVKMLSNVLANLQATLSDSKTRAKEFKERIKERKNHIHHLSNLDMQGKDATPYDTDNAKKKALRNVVLRTVFSPTYTFEQYLKLFGDKNVKGEGYLYNYFMSEWNDSVDSEQIGKEENRKALDAKAKALFGKGTNFMSLIGLDGKKLDEMDCHVTDVDGEKRTIHLKQGQMLYIYLVNKEIDGAMKLRAMGITDSDVAAIETKLDPKVKAMGEWLQDEYLPICQRRYQNSHVRFFGAPMKEVDNYFPLMINQRARNVNEDVNQDSAAKSQLAGTTTGAIVTRKVNTIPLDIENADAFAVALNHLNEMEEWAAMLPFRQDINTLLSYTRFRNQVTNLSSKAYGNGEALWKQFMQCAQIAAGTYKPKVDNLSIDSKIAKALGMVSMAKISGRLWTAAKQTLSFPAFWTEASPVKLIKNTFNPLGSYKWAKENMPLYRKRIERMTVGDTRINALMDDMEKTHNLFMSIAKKGMLPNIFVDAVTCAVGARSVYETEYEKLKELGYPDDVAEDKAVRKAVLSYNKSQQSSEGAFVAPMQVDRTYVSAALSLYKNSNYAYGRSLIEAARGLGRSYKFWGGHPKYMVEQMKRQIEFEDGLSSDDAEKIARRAYNRAFVHNLGVIFNYLTVVPITWALGSVLPYLLLGDDDDKKKKYIEEAFIKGFATSVTEDYAIPFLSDITNSVVEVNNGRIGFNMDGMKNVDLYVNPATSDLANMIGNIANSPWSAASSAGLIGIQALIGFNPQTVGSLVQAFAEFDKSGKDVPTEVKIAVLKAMNAPEANIRDLYLDELGLNDDEAKKFTVEELAERYAERRMNKDVGVGAKYVLPKDSYDALVEKYTNSFNKRIQDYLDKMDEADKKKVDSIYNSSVDSGIKEMIGKKRAKDAKAETEERLADEGYVKEEKEDSPAEAEYKRIMGTMDLADDVAMKERASYLRKKYANQRDEYNDLPKNQKYLYLNQHKYFKEFLDIESKNEKISDDIKKLKEKLVNASRDERKNVMEEIRKLKSQIMENQRMAIDKFVN